MERNREVQLLREELIYRGRIFNVRRESVRLPSGLSQDLELIEHGGAVAIAALDDQGRLLLVRQYRHATGDWLVEVPAGRLEPGEDPEQAARRELEEETGYRAARWTVLARFFPAPGFCSEHMTLFLARELDGLGSERRPHDPDEELELLRLAPAAVLTTSRDAKTLLAAALLAAG